MTQVGNTGVYYRYFNRIVEVFVDTATINVSNMGTVIATLPDTIPKPAMAVRVAAGESLNPSVSNITVNINTDNKVTAIAYAAININVYAHAMYFA